MDRDSTGQARSWLLGDPPPGLSRPAGPYRRGDNARTARHDPPPLSYGWLSHCKRVPYPALGTQSKLKKRSRSLLRI